MDGINFNVVQIQIQSKPISKDLHFWKSGKKAFLYYFGVSYRRFRQIRFLIRILISMKKILFLTTRGLYM